MSYILALLLALGTPGQLVMVWDLRDLNQVGQLTIYNDDDFGSSLGEPVGAGDVDGDGYADVVTCAFYSSAGPANERGNAGKLHLWFGGPDVLRGGVIYDAEHPAAPTVEIWGARTGDFLGTEVDEGDVNGDGFVDILACAENASGFGNSTNRTGAGVLYVILGRAEWSGPIDLATSPAGVVEILGAHANDRCGFWATSGDVDGDGMRDIVVAADLARNTHGDASGVVYVIPGRADLPARIDLADADTIAELGITTIAGIDREDHFGASLATGDFDGDHIADIAIGAGLGRSGAIGHPQGGADGPNESRPDAGEAYIVFGRSAWPASIQVTDPPSDDVVIYYGDQVDARFGEDLHTGDIDGDGKDELGVGALLGNAPGRSASGIGYIFWSESIAGGTRVDADDAPGSVMTKIYGQESGDIGADTMLLADIDADGLADVLFGSPTNSPPGLSGAGDLKVIYSNGDRFPSIIDTADPPAGVTIFRLVPPNPDDLFTYSIAVGDVDGDGITDLVPNAMGGDGAGNRHENAGEAYVISGRELAGRAGRPIFVAPELSSVSVTPDLPKYYAGQSGIELVLRAIVTDVKQGFAPGAVVILRGIEVPSEFVSSTELRVRLDDAPEVRNAPGPLNVQVRNPGTATSAVVPSIDLVGPVIAKATITRKGSVYVLKVKGTDFLEGALLEVLRPDDSVVTPVSVTRKSETTIRAKITRSDVTRGTSLDVRVINPGPAPSNGESANVP